MRNTLELVFSKMFAMLAEEGIFVSHNLVKNKDKTTLQFSTNDPELLSLFAQWRNTTKLDSEGSLSLLKFDQKQSEIRLQLIDFLDSLDSTQYENLDQIKTQIQ